MYLRLTERARDAYPLEHARDFLSVPPGWDSPAFCENLSSSRSADHDRLNVTAERSISRLADDRREHKSGLQSKLYKALQDSRPDPWPGLIASRVAKLVPDAAGFDFCSVWEPLKPLLNKLGPAMVHSIIKTWSNSWTTSRRYHDQDPLPGCLFGCDVAQDDLAHYLICQPFWTCITCGAGLSEGWLDQTPLQRLGLANPSLRSLSILLVASRVYHTLRQGRDEIVRSSFADSDFLQVSLLAIEQARLHSADLMPPID